MDKTAPKFSVIIATHQRPRLLDRALRSVCQQAYPCQQIIVVSDAKDVETCTVASDNLRSGDLFLQRQGSPGPAESRNLGMKLNTADYFIFLDDDDTFGPDFLANIAHQLAGASAQDQVFYTNFEIVNEKADGAEIVVTEIQSVDLAGHDPARIYVKNFIPNNCLIFPGRLAAEITFDADIAYEDWDFILSACGRSQLTHLPIGGPRIHKNTAALTDQRGKKNDAGLVECYTKIYSKHPPPSQVESAWRRELFASIGLDIDALLHHGH